MIDEGPKLARIRYEASGHYHGLAGVAAAVGASLGAVQLSWEAASVAAVSVEAAHMSWEAVSVAVQAV